MKTFAGRRIAHGLVLVAALAGAAFVWRALDIALRPAAIYSGVGLLVLVLLLALFGARKKLPFLPLLNASSWLQFHIYAGFFCVFLYGLHTSFRIPAGTLELGLAFLFAVVTVSGVIGLVISRVLPPLMSRAGEPLTYEKIPGHEVRLRREVEALVEEAERDPGASAVGELYLAKLAAYFRPRSPFRFFLRGPRRLRGSAMDEIDKIDRYLRDDGRTVLDRLKVQIERKHNLDVQKSCQFFLRCWLFIHIPFTYSLVIASLVHAWIALVFTTSR